MTSLIKRRARLVRRRLLAGRRHFGQSRGPDIMDLGDFYFSLSREEAKLLYGRRAKRKTKPI